MGSIGPPHSHTSFLFAVSAAQQRGIITTLFSSPTQQQGRGDRRLVGLGDRRISLSQKEKGDRRISLSKKKRRPEEDTHGGGALFCSAPSPLQAPPSLPLFPHRPQQFSAAYSFASKFRGAARGEGARRHDDAGGWSTATSWCSRPWSAW